MKKRLLVIFPNEWLAYTPSLLNIVAGLKDSFDIKVIAVDDDIYKNDKKIHNEEVEFIKIEGTIAKIINWISKLFGNYRLYELLKMLVLYNRVRKHEADEIIAVDALGLLLAQKIYKQCHFLSLEPYKNFFFRQCNIEQIESVIAQTQERYDYLFGDVQLKTFLIQNSPSFKPGSRTYEPRTIKKAIYFGSAIPRNGIYLCLEAIANLPNVSLTIKGTISEEVEQVLETKYAQLLANKKIEIDNSYVNQTDIVEYLSEFYVGFCFYDLNLTDKTTKFNFISVPSGKLFNYYAAGVPVIASDILGLKSVKDFQTGILLQDISAKNITQAMEAIDAQHQKFSENCLKAAAHFDFDRALEPFKDYLLNKT